MRTLILLMLLSVLMVAAFCYESHESMESHEFVNPFINRRNANDFMRAQPRRNFMVQERIRERNKTPRNASERSARTTTPVNAYAMRHGYIAAYKRYFGQRRGKFE